MKMNERERCCVCQKWVNIYKDFCLDPRYISGQKDGMPWGICGKCLDKIIPTLTNEELIEAGLPPKK